MLKSLNVFTFLLLHIVIIAQADSTIELPQVIAKISITDFLHPYYPAAQVGLEHKLQKYWYLQHQVGYIFYNPFYKYNNNVSFINQSGLRLRSGIRRYVKSSLYRDLKTFLELNFSYLHIRSTLEDGFYNYGCSCQELLPYYRRQETYSAMLYIGFANYTSHKWAIEFGASAGVQFGYIRFSGLPLGTQISEPWIPLYKYQYSEIPSVFPILVGLRLKVGYILK